LRNARLQRGWEVDQVAEMTKIRPERVLDMEADDYSEFPSLVYARSFLSKYANLLGVDIRGDLDNLRVSHSISLADYQYLRSVPFKHAPASRPIEPRAFRVPPLLVAFLVLLVLVGLPVFAYLAIGLARLQPRFANELATPAEAAAGSPIPGAAQPSPAETLQSLVKDSPSPAAAIASATPPASPPQQPIQPAAGGPAGAVAAAPSPVPAAVASPNPVSSPAPALAEQSPQTESSPEPGRSPAVATGSPAASAPGPEPSPAPDEGKRLEVRALRRTYIRVVRDERGSQPVFSGYASPKAEPIVVKGKRFWLKVSDRRAVEVREDGQVVRVRSANTVIN
jgi:cytoskeletal protein RodZ